MPAVRRAVRLTDHDVSVYLRLAAVRGDVTDEGKHLDLRIDRNPFVVLPLPLEKAQRDPLESADGREVTGGEFVLFSKGQQAARNLIALVEDDCKRFLSVVVDQLCLHVCLPLRLRAHSNSFSLSRKSVRAIFLPSGCPFMSASAKWSACSTLTFGGIGGSNGSTNTSTIVGLPDCSARSKAGRISSGLSPVKPMPLTASAYLAKFGLCSSLTYSGFPHK